MTTTGFVSSFGGTSLFSKLRAPETCTPRMVMGDSVAPKIRITDTKSDQTSKILIEWEKVDPNESTAVAVTGNMGLYTALKSKSPSSLPGSSITSGPCPEGMSPVEYYFPAKYRNKAPKISLESDKSISVSYDEINTIVGGISSNSVEKEKVAFWKQKTFEYAAPETSPSDSVDPEILATSLYEKYYPSSVRNKAPFIKIKAPAGEWDTSAFVQVGSSFVGLNPELAFNLSVQAAAEEPNIKASATVAKFFGQAASLAPVIRITGQEEVAFGMESIPLDLDTAGQVARNAMVPATE